MTTPVFGIFHLIGSLFYTPTQFDWPLLSAEKIGLSLSHIVPEILGLKVGLIFPKMYYLTDFKHFISIFFLIFNPIDPLFHWFYIFLTPHFHKTLDLNGSNFLCVQNQATKNLMKYPCPPPLWISILLYFWPVIELFFLICNSHFMIILIWYM